MRKLHNHTTNSHPTTFDAMNSIHSHVRVAASPSPTYAKIRHYG